MSRSNVERIEDKAKLANGSKPKQAYGVDWRRVLCAAATLLSLSSFEPLEVPE